MNRERHSRDYDFYLSLRERALAIVRTNLLVYAAFVPASAVLFENEIVSLSEILTSPVTAFGLCLSAVAVGSAGMTLLMIQLRTRQAMISNSFEMRDKSDESVTRSAETNDIEVEITDYIGITEFLTAVSTPLILLGISASVIDISFRMVVFLSIGAVLGAVIVRLGVKQFLVTVQTFKTFSSKLIAATTFTAVEENVSDLKKMTLLTLFISIYFPFSR
ncbi:hypothetical protein RYH80_05780 [Halobaculum sp. MBLA0147]|uniref:hypothetical protein n=1 Tax=Halobaculum sp. MBLA0147 TaxID=3079934 RepID=UPI00352482F4